MKRLLFAAIALLFLYQPAQAQFTTVTASSIKMSGTPIATGSDEEKVDRLALTWIKNKPSLLAATDQRELGK